MEVGVEDEVDVGVGVEAGIGRASGCDVVRKGTKFTVPKLKSSLKS